MIIAATIAEETGCFCVDILATLVFRLFECIHFVTESVVWVKLEYGPLLQLIALLDITHIMLLSQHKNSITDIRDNMLNMGEHCFIITECVPASVRQHVFTDHLLVSAKSAHLADMLLTTYTI